MSTFKQFVFHSAQSYWVLFTKKALNINAITFLANICVKAPYIESGVYFLVYFSVLDAVADIVPVLCVLWMFQAAFHHSGEGQAHQRHGVSCLHRA